MVHYREGAEVECNSGGDKQDEHHPGDFEFDTVEFYQHANTFFFAGVKITATF